MGEAQLVSINMGYGHQRTAFALRQLAFEKKIINANDYPGIPAIDKKIWESTRRFYEFMSAFKKFPIFGNLVFAIFDAFQKILNFYPRRDLSKPNFTLKNNYSLLKKRWGRDLIERLSKDKIPLISTFFTPAFMAEFFNYPGEIFCVVCDADISRTWASLEPKKSRIKYFAPTERVVERLKLYGVNSKNIFLTGYPLPLEIIGSERLEILKENFKKRIINLDPRGKYREKYRTLIKENLGELPEKPDHLLTIMFAVGGAGAQKETGIKIIKSLEEKIRNGQVKIILVAGIKEKVKDYFMENIKILKLEEMLNSGIELLFKEDINNYFQAFNEALRKADILWTKPSELSFYTALGLPIIISPTIGSQEEFNKRWLLKSGFGVLQENPDYTNQWLFDWLGKGYLAKAAMQGFIEGEKLGTINIRKICFGY
jgi:UDP-N-acetylglucosamine:LPS N-acetylglucosamine transferase